MCGRYAITLPPEAMRAFFRYVEQPNFPPRYNIAPTQPVPIVRRERDPQGGAARHFVLVRWGFLPGFVKPWLDSFRNSPGRFVIGVLLVAALIYAGGWLQGHIRDVMRGIEQWPRQCCRAIETAT